MNRRAAFAHAHRRACCCAVFQQQPDAAFGCVAVFLLVFVAPADGGLLALIQRQGGGEQGVERVLPVRGDKYGCAVAAEGLRGVEGGGVVQIGDEIEGHGGGVVQHVVRHFFKHAGR